jgi:arylformamidase
MQGLAQIKEVIDLSISLGPKTRVFPGYPQPAKKAFTTIKDQGYNSFMWSFVEHTSTHVDAPRHFFDDGISVDNVPIGRYVSQGIVLDFTNKNPRYSISKEDIRRSIDSRVGPGWAILFHTGYTEKSNTDQWMEHPELSEEACKYIAELGVNAVGFDAPSPDHAPFAGHKILLPKMISVYENLTNLDKLRGKNFLFIGAPLALEGGTASPVRALALVM